MYKHRVFLFSKVRTSNLDRDLLDDSYSVGIVVIDSGNPRLYDTMYVNVTITDINDKPPVFKDSSFITLNVEEDSQIDGGNRKGTGKELISNNQCYCLFFTF